MKVLGIIAEYNPFHNGHKYHLEQSIEKTEADVTVAVISGNFVQRGEPGLFDKWIRSKMAVQNGVDLVLELPFAYACNNADFFARGAVSLLDGLGCVDSISFGSEVGDVNVLSQIASFLVEETDEFSILFKEKMKEGKSFPAARAETLTLLFKKYNDFSAIDSHEFSNIIQSPNNLLGIEYLKWLKIFDSKIRPVTIKRFGAGINSIDEESDMAGATAIRRIIDSGNVHEALSYVTEESKASIEDMINHDIDKEVFVNMENFYQLVVYSIISKSIDELKDIYSITEGLENKVMTTVQAMPLESVKAIVNGIKSKRYTETRIKRILMHILMGLTKEKMNRITSENQMYGRVLAFNEKGASLLKHIKNEECNSVPIITNISKESNELKSCQDLLKYDILASDVYNLAVKGDVYSGSDYRQIPAYLRD